MGPIDAHGLVQLTVSGQLLLLFSVFVSLCLLGRYLLSVHAQLIVIPRKAPEKGSLSGKCATSSVTPTFSSLLESLTSHDYLLTVKRLLLIFQNTHATSDGARRLGPGQHLPWDTLCGNLPQSRTWSKATEVPSVQNLKRHSL